MSFHRLSHHLADLFSGKAESDWQKRLEQPPVIEPERARQLYEGAVGAMPLRHYDHLVVQAEPTQQQEG